jgi:hypothetical protein
VVFTPTSQQSSREPSRTELDGRTYVRAVMALRDPRRPSRPLPRRLVRRLPDPMTEDGWARFVGDDLADATPAERGWEAAQLRVAVALVDHLDRVPAWLFHRLKALES